MKSGDKILLVLLVLTAAVSAAALHHSHRSAGNLVAVVTSGDQVVRRINLAEVNAPFTFRVDAGPGKYNVIAVEPGRIRVIEASCPLQIDVKQGWISASTQSIVCVPNRLVIRIESAGEPDGLDGIAQ